MPLERLLPRQLRLEAAAPRALLPQPQRRLPLFLSMLPLVHSDRVLVIVLTGSTAGTHLRNAQGPVCNMHHTHLAVLRRAEIGGD